jgi:hypothetical protein
MTSITKKEIMLFVKNALKSKNKIKMEKAILYFNKWKKSQRNYFYDLPDDMIWLINGLIQNIDPLFSFESAKQLSCEELDNLSINEKSIEVNMDELQVGDYIQTYSSKHSYKPIIKMVSRKTKFNIFLRGIEINFISSSPKSDCFSYNYYYVNIHKQSCWPRERKVLIKNEKIKKAIDNFIAIECFDMTN